MIFIETSLFTRLVRDYFTDDEYQGLQKHLLRQPEAGSVIAGSGGVRKLRWRTKGKGKRGGARVIYYWHVNEDEIWLLTLYSKSERGTIAAHILKRIVDEMKDV